MKNIFKSLNLSGVSVTVPHKEIAFNICDEVRGVAKEIKAVNCMILENNKLIGYNTDVYGFLDAIKEFNNIKDVLIIGAGGTAKALTVGFLEKGWNISIVNRSEKRLESFKRMPVKTFIWKTFQVENYDLVVNVTSAGLKDKNLPIAEKTLKQIFENSKYAVDVIYHETPFLKLAKEIGLKTQDGSLMLVYQGVLANQLFTENQISKKDIETAMLEIFQ
jgi:shikimate dehydrogenase